MDCQGEQQPAEICEADKCENDADDDHGGGSPYEIDGCAFHHHHGAMRRMPIPVVFGIHTRIG
jgi:hypothetical protein